LSPWNDFVFFRWLARPQGEDLIEAVIERYAGINVGKKFLVACVKNEPLEESPRSRFGNSERSSPNWTLFVTG
jgi:hypothetical protein